MAAKKDQEIVDAEIVNENLPAQPTVRGDLFRQNDVWDNPQEADVLVSSAMLEAKAALIGVPFVITKVVYRVGAYRRSKEVLPDDYVSIECVTAPERDRLYVPDKIRRIRSKAADDMTGALQSKVGFHVEDFVGPNEFVVVNDSSTGIKRQITAYLSHKGMIQPSLAGTVELPAIDDLKGGLGENVFDQNRDEWASGSQWATDGINVTLMCRQGLRVSAYENDLSAEGNATFYLA